jgi:predicted transcriptional regulator
MTTHTNDPNTNIATAELLNLTAEIVTSYVSNKSMDSTELTEVVRAIYATLSGLASGHGSFSASRPAPAIAIKKSVSDDYIICLEDGKKLKMLKRHLRSSYNMSPDQYRERWNLPADYPMVAPSYARKRSQLAKNIGLGNRPRRADKLAA